MPLVMQPSTATCELRHNLRRSGRAVTGTGGEGARVRQTGTTASANRIAATENSTGPPGEPIRIRYWPAVTEARWIAI